MLCRDLPARGRKELANGDEKKNKKEWEMFNLRKQIHRIRNKRKTERELPILCFYFY